MKGEALEKPMQNIEEKTCFTRAVHYYYREICVQEKEEKKKKKKTELISNIFYNWIEKKGVAYMEL